MRALAEEYRKANPASAGPAELMSNSRQDRGAKNALRLREIQFHANAIGVVHEELRIAGTRHDTFAEFDVVLLQALAHALDIGGGKGDVIETAGVLVFLLGAAYHDAFARLARAHQMHRGDAAGIEPIAGKIERRSIAVLQAQHFTVEVLGALKVLGFDGVMLQSAKWHGCSPCKKVGLDEGEVGLDAQHPGADGFKMAEPALQLLSHGVDVAESTLQRMPLEDRGGSGGVIGEINRLAPLVDGVGGGHADDDALFDRDA